MSASLISSVMFGVLSGSLFGQSVTLNVSGLDTPLVSSHAIVLQSPDYAFDLKCQGGPWKFQLSGSPDFSPSPTPGSDHWWECPDALRVHLAVSKQPAQLSIASARAETVSGSTVLVSISWAEPVSPGKANSTETPAQILSVIGLFLGAISIILALLLWRKMAAANEVRTKEGTRNAEEIAKQLELITKVEALSQSETTLRNEIEQLRREIRDWKTSKDDAKSFEVPPDPMELMSNEVTPQSEALARPSSSPGRDDSGGKTAPGAVFLLRAVESWRSQTANLTVEPPGQLAQKINELRAMAEGAGKLSAVGSRESASEWRDLAFSIACLVADHTDKHIDPRREEPRWQVLLQEVFQSAGIEEVFPARNAVVNDFDHHILVSVPRESANDLSDHVAFVRQRGFRMGGRLIRKAAVAAYD
jgi:hypothetical protein